MLSGVARFVPPEEKTFTSFRFSFRCWKLIIKSKVCLDTSWIFCAHWFHSGLQLSGWKPWVPAVWVGGDEVLGTYTLLYLVLPRSTWYIFWAYIALLELLGKYPGVPDDTILLLWCCLSRLGNTLVYLVYFAQTWYMILKFRRGATLVHCVPGTSFGVPATVVHNLIYLVHC